MSSQLHFIIMKDVAKVKYRTVISLSCIMNIRPPRILLKFMLRSHKYLWKIHS